MLFILIIIIILVKRRKRKHENQEPETTRDDNEDASEPIYAEIDEDRKELYASMMSQDVEVVGIEVVTNESYAMLNSNSFIVQRYGTLEGSGADHTEHEREDRT